MNRITRCLTGVFALKNAIQSAAIRALVDEPPPPPLLLGEADVGAALVDDGLPPPDGLLLLLLLLLQPASTPARAAHTTTHDRCHPVSFRIRKVCLRRPER